MGKKFKTKIRQIAMRSSDLVDIVLFGSHQSKIELNFPKNIRINKSMKEVFESDIKNVAGDVRKSISTVNG